MSDANGSADSQPVTAEHPLAWTRTPALALGAIGAIVLLAVGLLFSRPDAVVLALPLAVWTALVHRLPASSGRVRTTLAVRAEEDDASRVSGRVGAEADAEMLQLAVDQSGQRTALVDAAPAEDMLRTESRLRHSGPVDFLAVTLRAAAGDGAWTSAPLPTVHRDWNAVPPTVPLRALPVSPRLRGLGGAHAGTRPGRGGDFRDIHPFAPGDELRRVDWRATARLARTPGELFVRRSNALSEASVVIAIDTADDLGQIVATWGTGDPERSGVTSLDHAREAALSLASTAIMTGDRVSYHELVPGGRTVPGGTGRRQLARLRGAIAATGVGAAQSGLRRMPPLPQGAIVFVLSTFFDGAAARLATDWQAAGHRVIAVDVLPALDAGRLSGEQKIAMRTLLAERTGVLADLGGAGVDVIPWSEGPEAVEVSLRIAERGRR